MKRVMYGIFVVGICCGLFGFSTVSLAAKWAVKEELSGRSSEPEDVPSNKRSW